MPEQVQKVQQMIGNNDPKQMFYSLCEQNNIDPEEILSQIR